MFGQGGEVGGRRRFSAAYAQLREAALKGPLFHQFSERKLRRQLNAARPSATEEWIADTNVTGGANLVPTVANFAIAGDIEPAIACGCGIQVRSGIGYE
jgi:hypothetical protein